MQGATSHDHTALAVGLDRAAELLGSLPFDVPAPEQAARRARRDAATRSVHDFLLPRLVGHDAPLVAVILGSTGSGKSTLINGLAQDAVSRPGVTRPTTSAPKVWCHVDHAHRYADEFLTGYGAAGRPIEVHASDDDLLTGLTIIDTPDIDSAELVHHEIAADLLAVADLVLFVTSAQRYADAVPWEFLRNVRHRGTPTLYVLNRAPKDPTVILDDYRRRLVDERVAGEDVAITVIGEHPIETEHRGFAADVVADLRATLAERGDPEQREAGIDAAVGGALGALVADLRTIAQDVALERATVDSLIEAARTAYAAQIAELVASLRDGTLIRDEVLARWEQFVGTGKVLSQVSNAIGRIGRSTIGLLRGQQTARTVTREARSELASVVTRRAQVAVGNVVTAWQMTEPGRALLGAVAGSAYQADPETTERTSRALVDWTAQLTEMVETEGGGRKRIAQVASVGVNGVAVMALLATFAHTGGLTGTEVGVTAGAAAAQQKVLEHAFGVAAARSLVQRARATLEQTLAAVLTADAQRFVTAAEALVADAETARELRDLADTLERDARASGFDLRIPDDVATPAHVARPTAGLHRPDEPGAGGVTRG